jgi:hypothetical protein
MGNLTSLRQSTEELLGLQALSDDERSLPLYRVLEEEYALLHDEKPAREADAARAESEWSLTRTDILDLAGLSQKLLVTRRHAKGPPADTLDSIVRLAAHGLPDALCRRLDDYTAARMAEQDPERAKDIDEQAAPLANILADVFTLLLDDGSLCRDASALDANVSSEIRDLLRHRDGATAGANRKLNRLLLEAAFPEQLRTLRDARLDDIFTRIREQRHAALCLSGGGIRSATFALGVIQGLARHRLLERFNYLSTVSGGGYLGGWLSAWIARSCTRRVVDDLRGAPRSKVEPEPEPIRHLRAYSNFLSPRFGLFSADTWTLVATYVRNLLLGWLVLVPLLAAVLLIPRIAVSVIRWVPKNSLGVLARYLPFAVALSGCVLGAVAIAFVHRNRPESGAHEGTAASRSRAPDQQTFIVWCLVPLVLSAMALTTSWAWVSFWRINDWTPGYQRLVFMMVGAAMHFAGWLFAMPFLRRGARRDGLIEAVLVVITGSLAGLVASGAAQALYHLADWPREQLPYLLRGRIYDLYVTVALPSTILLILLGGQLWLGLVSRTKSPMAEDAAREWAARFNAWLLIAAVGWLLGSSLVLFGPPLSTLAITAVSGVGGITGLITLFLGSSGVTPAKRGNDTPSARGVSRLLPSLQSLVLAVAAPVFAALLVVLLSAAGAWLIRLACALYTSGCTSPVVADDGGNAHIGVVLGITALLTLMGVVMGGAIDTNKFSLHAMYRVRLIRAYLGASRPAGQRKPDPFTGFDDGDDLALSSLWPAHPSDAHPKPPLHVVNVALNLVKGSKLAWQERKAASFTFTSLHAGAPTVGYRRTSPAPGTVSAHPPLLYGGGRGPSLGTALTISGAAASPNMGYNSSPIVTFLMTLFNARLGWWLGNPCPEGDKTFFRSAPRAAFRPLIDELFGLTDDRHPYVYLSDGGHFENLGLYEMVLRRNRLIVVCDASCDEACSFADLGNAIRKIRIDLGVPIEFRDSISIFPRRPMAAANATYWALADIRYSCVDRRTASGAAMPDTGYDPEYDGTLLYIKPAFYGQEPRDVYNYGQVSKTFPHETTADQWFSESQFESYRALGSYIVDELFAELAASEEGNDAATLRAALPEERFRRMNIAAGERLARQRPGGDETPWSRIFPLAELAARQGKEPAR